MNSSRFTRASPLKWTRATAIWCLIAAATFGLLACDPDSAPPASVSPTGVPATASTPASVGFSAGGPSGEFAESANSLEGAVPPAPQGFEPPLGDPSDGRFMAPLAAWTALLQGFGEVRRDGLIHGGLDFGLEGRGSSPVKASCRGTVTEVKSDDSYGMHVVIDCGDGWTTLYGFLGAVQVRMRQLVGQGAIIATSDSTGAPLHFQLAYNGVPLNPEEYVDLGTAPRPTPTPAPAQGIIPTATVVPATTQLAGATEPPSATATPTPPTPSATVSATKTPTRTPTSKPTATPTRRLSATPTPPPPFQP